MVSDGQLAGTVYPMIDAMAGSHTTDEIAANNAATKPNGIPNTSTKKQMMSHMNATMVAGGEQSTNGFVVGHTVQ